jgi:hypothetical protein
MSISITNSFAKPLRLVLSGAILIAGAAAAAEPKSDPQSLAQQLLSPSRVAASDHAATGGSVALPDAQEQARRLLTGTNRDFKSSGVRIASPSRELRSHRSVEARDLARRMILGHEA